MTDVVVVGGGPAGCAAAITLARAGRDVLLVDKAGFPRDKCCGDGLTTGALRLLESLGADPTGLDSWHGVGDVSIRSPSGRIVRVPLPAGGGSYGGVCRRAELDAHVIATARRAGVRVEEGTSFVSIAPGAGGEVEVGLDPLGVVKVPHVVAADGVWSPVRRALGGGQDYRGEWHAFRRYYRHVAPEAAEHLWIWFDPEVVPGYAWSFPLAGGRANVGVTLRRRPGTRGADLAALFSGVLDSPWFGSLVGRRAEPEGPSRSWPIPTSPRGTPLSALGGKVLFAGDAARVADALTGEGVAQAIETGTMAAKAIEVGGGDPGLAAGTYAASVRRSLRVDNELAAVISTVMGWPGGARGAVRLAGLGFMRDHFGAWLFEDYPRAAVLTPWRWGEIGRGGAYRTPRSRR